MCNWPGKLSRRWSLYVHLHDRHYHSLFDSGCWNHLEHQPVSTYSLLPLSNINANLLLSDQLYRPRDHT